METTLQYLNKLKDQFNIYIIEQRRNFNFLVFRSHLKFLILSDKILHKFLSF